MGRGPKDSKIRQLNNVLAFVEILEGTAEKVLKQISSIENEHITPTLFLPTTRSCRETRNRELTEIGAVYAAQAAALKSIEDRIAQQRNKLVQLSANHRNATCPIGSIPMEVLHQILLFAAEGTPRKVIRVAPLVCQFWNKALACLPVVWNNCGSRAGDLDFLTVPLTRAGPKANVTISPNNVPRWLGEPNLRAKVSTLTLSTLSPVSDLEVFCATTLPNLVTLTLKRTQQSSAPAYTGDVTVPTHATPRLRRIIIDSIPFNFIRISYPCCSHSTIEIIELQNAPIYLPYLFKSLEAFRKIRQLRLIKITEGDPLDEVHNNEIDSYLPDTLEVVTIHQCDWETTRLFFEAPSFAKLRELRLAFPIFDSDPIFDFAHHDTHLSNLPVGELSPAAFCCLSLSDAVSIVYSFTYHCFSLTPHSNSVVWDARSKGILHH
jgi:hypothetical protein